MCVCCGKHGVILPAIRTNVILHKQFVFDLLLQKSSFVHWRLNKFLLFNAYYLYFIFLFLHTSVSELYMFLFLCSLMQLFDTDEDEKITREEFTALLRSALGVSDLNMTKLFKEIDADGSGFITFSECKYQIPSYCKFGHFFSHQWKHDLSSTQLLLCLFVAKMNFKPLPQHTQSMPSSSQHTWSFRDTKQSRRPVQVISSCLVKPDQRKTRKTAAPLTKRMTEKSLPLQWETDLWIYCTEKENTVVISPPTTFRKLRSLTTEEPY